MTQDRRPAFVLLCLHCLQGDQTCIRPYRDGWWDDGAEVWCARCKITSDPDTLLAAEPEPEPEPDESEPADQLPLPLTPAPSRHRWQPHMDTLSGWRYGAHGQLIEDQPASPELAAWNRRRLREPGAPMPIQAIHDKASPYWAQFNVCFIDPGIA